MRCWETLTNAQGTSTSGSATVIKVLTAMRTYIRLYYARRYGGMADDSATTVGES